MALKDMDVGMKILGGIVAFALLMAMMSNGDPDNDAWGAGDAGDGTEDEDDPPDPWSAGPDDGGDVPTCDGVAPFTTGEGTIRLPVSGPVVPFPSSVCQLGPGSRDASAVRVLQHALAACNGQVLSVDGIYGADTRHALAAVQDALGLEADGLYGPLTRAAMAWPTEPASVEGAGTPEDDPAGTEDSADAEADAGTDADAAPAAEDDAGTDADAAPAAEDGASGDADDAPSSACISGG